MVGLRAGWLDMRMAVYRAGYIAVNWVGRGVAIWLIVWPIGWMRQGLAQILAGWM